MTSTTNSKKSVSYRRNRDYSKQFRWTYELNKDLFNCYTKAKEDPKKGYMKRMKTLWDDLHPEFGHFKTSRIITFVYSACFGMLLNKGENSIRFWIEKIF